MSKNNKNIMKNPDQVRSYFQMEKWTLFLVTVSGIFYNVGMIAGPWFEGQLVQRLLDIMSGKKEFADMVSLALFYVGVILAVQGARFMKRLYVRKFANHINRAMKQVLYGSIVRKSRKELEEEGIGNLMTKAMADVDTCVEGMRKFTTEVFDTGVVMIAYMVMLMWYDWKLALLSMIFPPLAYVIAEKLKVIVSASAAEYKKSAGQLNSATMDRVTNAMTYRVYGQEENQNQRYEEALTSYEKKAAFANIWETAMQPIYQIISTLGVIFILWFGGKNVLGEGWTNWNIAAFTTFLSCFTKLAVKSSKAAKLFNAVQKAKVSWKRIKPYLGQTGETTETGEVTEKDQQTAWENKKTLLQVQNLSFRYEDGEHEILHNLSFTARAGEIIGVAGPVACGKSTLGKIFLCEQPYQGHVLLGGAELWQQNDFAGYMGHQPELFSASIEENILLGETGDVRPVLKAVCMEEEIQEMPDGIATKLGKGGMRLSGGQQARIALARTLYHKKALLILDDPFSAVDKKTEGEIVKNCKPMVADQIVLLLSHRLDIFLQLDQIIWLGETPMVADHQTLMKENEEYAQMYELQMGGAHEKA